MENTAITGTVSGTQSSIVDLGQATPNQTELTAPLSIGATVIQGEQGNPTQQDDGAKQNPVFKQFKTQQEYDNEAANIRRASEREAKKELLKSLGLNPNEEEKLAEYKKAYEDSLTTQEWTEKELERLQLDNDSLLRTIEDKDYYIAVLSAMSGIDTTKIEMIVRMARGLKDENTTIEDAIQAVMQMTNIVGGQEQTPSTGQKVGMPHGINLIQPETPPTPELNPFKTGPNGEPPNLTEQGRLYKEDPEKARRFAREAGVPIGIR